MDQAIRAEDEAAGFYGTAAGTGAARAWKRSERRQDRLYP